MEKIKTKNRFTSLDVCAMVANLQTLIGLRTVNIYDLNPTTYLFKLSRAEEKHILLVENGVRFHTIEDTADKKKTVPSGFTMKFRKFLRSKRLEGVRQVGVERVVVLTFGSDAHAYHLILELYAQGNIILTDTSYRIIQLIRTHQYDADHKTAVGEVYPFEKAANIYLENMFTDSDHVAEALKAMEEKESATTAKKGKGGGGGIKLKDVVFKVLPCLFPLYIEQILGTWGIDPEQPASMESLQEISGTCTRMLEHLRQFTKSNPAGHIYERIKEGAQHPEYVQFTPYVSPKYQSSPLLKAHAHQTFNESVAAYFQHFNKGTQVEPYEDIAWRKYEQIKRDQDDRVKRLQDEQQMYQVKAELIEKNIDEVDAIIRILKTIEENGYSWDEISRMVSESRKNGDPLANMIHDLKIAKREATVLLMDQSECASQQDRQLMSMIAVEVNIDYNAFTNATIYYQSRKKNFQKELRTKEASGQVLKIAEKDALKVIEKRKNEELAKNIPQRKRFWFEKFYWFVSSEGILVISGRDSQQNERLVKRYMKAGDLYMHSDYGGAASTIIKRSEKGQIIPKLTLEEAAVFTVCRSKAWETKILSGAWWVFDHQVSKSAPTGQFLPTGSFMIRGKRNFINPNRMEMGVALVYRIDAEAAARRNTERKTVEEVPAPAQEQKDQPNDVQEEFAIIKTDTQPKQKKQQQKGQRSSIKSASAALPMMKKASSSYITREEPPVESDGQEQSETHSDTQHSKNATLKKVPKPKVDQNLNQNAIKQPYKNKKKLKKLEKHLDQQDEEEREVIMKMLGAKQMKHVRPAEQESDSEEQKKASSAKKNKKKGMAKYLDNNNDAEEKFNNINTDKVLFLKEKHVSSYKKPPSEDKNLFNPPKTVEKPITGINKQVQVKPQNVKEVFQTKTVEQKQTSHVSNESCLPIVPIVEVTLEVKKQSDQLPVLPGQLLPVLPGEQAVIPSDEEEDSSGEQEPKQVAPKEEEDVDDKTMASQLIELSRLVGSIRPDERFENLVAMCAPYIALREHKLKVKLTPGGMKKGKAARAVLQYLTGLELTQAEKMLVKQFPQQQVIETLISGVRLAGVGILGMKLKEKEDKKEKKKEKEKVKVE